MDSIETHPTASGTEPCGGCPELAALSKPADPCDLLQQAFKEAGVDVTFVDCTPEEKQG